ncbi:pickpocket protein 28 isoform X3 [Plutella xylostella]|uniref:pickpocket protein 28 isoform X3 n=1 Tax=Plutella xylostella TaxID=51655 RepID=UPI00203318F7|nr:pickpocket protein 28 isoform X3 [Plutella xylostella]
MVPTQERVRPCGCLPACSGAAARKDLREYLLTSTLHGLRYIGEGRLTWFERVFWLLAFAFSLICASFFILNIYDKWRSAPMIVSINPRSLLLADLPFPAVTICNVNQAKKSVAHRYKETGSSKDKKLLQSLCTSNNDTAIFDNSTDNADWEYFRAFLINVTQPCSEMLDQCYWNDERQDCQDLFNAQLTDEGLCCTFNVVHRDMMFRNPKDLYDLNLTFPLPAVDWTPEGGYPPDSPESGFPWRPLGTGTHHGLTLVLDTNIDEYYCGSTSSPGFKILLHNPTETPKIAAYGDIYGPGAEARVAVTPRILDAQPQLQAIDRAQRLCVFSSERNLTFYRTYTQRNCEMECEAETMLNTCQCVQYFMPKNRSTRVCGKADAECYSGRTLPGNLSSLDLLLTPRPSQVTARSRAAAAAAACRRARRSRTVSAAAPRRSATRSSSRTATSARRRPTTSTNTGGLLGLCMGFSMMSFIELIYFLTLKALCATIKRKPRPRHFPT